MDRHIARTIVRNSAGDARVIWSIFSGYHPQELRESGVLWAGKGKGGTDQGRGNSIGIPKNPYVFHFRYLSCLFRSRLKFVNPIPPPIKRMLVSLKDLALEWTCMASWKTRVNCYNWPKAKLKTKKSYVFKKTFWMYNPSSVYRKPIYYILKRSES